MCPWSWCRGCTGFYVGNCGSRWELGVDVVVMCWADIRKYCFCFADGTFIGSMVGMGYHKKVKLGELLCFRLTHFHVSAGVEIVLGFTEVPAEAGGSLVSMLLSCAGQIFANTAFVLLTEHLLGHCWE